jgi:hypothetical protein
MVERGDGFGLALEALERVRRCGVGKDFYGDEAIEARVSSSVEPRPCRLNPPERSAAAVRIRCRSHPNDACPDGPPDSGFHAGAVGVAGSLKQPR